MQTKKLLKIAKLPVLQIVFFTLIALVVRLHGLSFITADMKVFLIPWFQKIQNGGGLLSLKHQIGDYGIPYQTIIALLSYLPFNPVKMYKSVSILFDFVLAASVAFLIRTFVPSKDLFISTPVLGYAIILLLPTTIWNSSIWGQCDAIYASFCILAITYAEKNKLIPSSLFLGLAFAFKLQTVFILPYFIYKILQNSNFKQFLYLLLAIIPMIVLSIPALLVGRNPIEIITIYFNQVSTYKAMSLNYPSFWPLIASPQQSDFYSSSSLLAIALAGIAILALLIFGLLHLDTDSQTNIVMAFVLVLTTVFFLPDMHERYGYLAEILVVIVAIMRPKFSIIAFVLELTASAAYGTYLFGASVPLPILSCVNLICLSTSLLLLIYPTLQNSPQISDSIG
ncbi:glycosyltransferase 87 family protein [Bifidobacterium sp. ESL0732]|uniref:glycosyltransferase 87 family protein n=1 Tax=Bifidobacterium sp. ESL0732 TaxID=2983222 RepID=UPI0023F923A2|nr:glycosyltransferase 87 family protein [Bifidobacterium sp. ESL0732]WEV63887.1 hypothetical protein OZX70_08165 [Bifidobacterium sp. ESL0732]